MSGSLSLAQAHARLVPLGAPKAPLDAPTVIGNAEQFREFVTSRAFPSKWQVILRIPGMAESETFAVSERLNANRAACGCSLAARTMTSAFLLSLALLMSNYGVFTLALLVRLPIAFAIGILFALLGKALGIGIGRRRTRREAARILAMFPD